MPVSGLLHGLVTGYAAETAQARKEQREREDQDFQHQLALLEHLRTDPRTTPELYQRVIADTLKLNKAKSAAVRPGQHSLAGVLTGASQPVSSQVLQDMADGKLPIFQHREAFDAARQGTLDDLPGGQNNPQAPLQDPSAGGPSVAGSMPATPPPPIQAPPQAQAAPQNIGAARPDGAGAQPGPPSMPAGPTPTPPGTGQMADAAKGLSEQVQLGGPLVPKAPQAAPQASMASRPFNDIVTKYAQAFKVRPELIHAIIRQESRYNPNARSSAGALGLMQMIPSTAQMMGVGNPMDPTENIRGGTRYFAQLLQRFGGDEKLALAAYNAGPERVAAIGGIPNIPETQDYVRRIMADVESGAAPTQGPQEATAVSEAPAGIEASPVPAPPAAAAGPRSNTLIGANREAPAKLPGARGQREIFSAHEGSPSAFFDPNEMSSIGASSEAAKIPIQAKADYDAAIAMGMEPKMAALAAIRKITGFSGGTIASRPGQLYVAPDGTLVKSLLQTDQYGGFVETDPRTNQPIAMGMEPFSPSEYTLETDKAGNVRAVNRAKAAAGVPGAVGPSLGEIGKPQIPPPGGPIVNFTGAKGEPLIGRVDRTGTDITPANVVTPPPPGSVPGTPGTRTPAVKFEMPRNLPAQAQVALQSNMVVKSVGAEALKLIDDLTKQGYTTTNPIPQEIYTRIYQMGWPNSNELEDQLNQLLGVNQVNGMKAYMGGRPNMRLQDVIQMHLPQPGDSLELSRRKLTELQSIVDTIDQAIYKSASTYIRLPWETGANQAPGGPGIDAPPAKTVTKELVTKYATEHNIQYDAALKVFTDKGYTLPPNANAAPAAR